MTPELIEPLTRMAASEVNPPLPRFKSTELFRNTREIEIDHNGRIYRMRLTHLNKLILTA